MSTISMKKVKNNGTVKLFKVIRIPVSLSYSILSRYTFRMEAIKRPRSLFPTKMPLKQDKSLKNNYQIWVSHRKQLNTGLVFIAPTV